MTWWSFSWHVSRLAPFLMKIRTGRQIDSADTKAFNDALLIPKRNERS